MFTRKSLEILIDLVEIKIGSIEASDAEDRRTISELERCRKELAAMTRPQPTNFASAPALAA
ncbi:MAG: hypothetical protein ACREIP_09050 [Alphaproteobacteria bacterium]